MESRNNRPAGTTGTRYRALRCSGPTFGMRPALVPSRLPLVRKRNARPPQRLRLIDLLPIQLRFQAHSLNGGFWGSLDESGAPLGQPRALFFNLQLVRICSSRLALQERRGHPLETEGRHTQDKGNSACPTEGSPFFDHFRSLHLVSSVALCKREEVINVENAQGKILNTKNRLRSVTWKASSISFGRIRICVSECWDLVALEERRRAQLETT
jgi:hypothetical protein